MQVPSGGGAGAGAVLYSFCFLESFESRDGRSIFGCSFGGFLFRILQTKKISLQKTESINIAYSAIAHRHHPSWSSVPRSIANLKFYGRACM
jgi:hypothetical protein